MSRGRIFADEYRPQFSGHETFPLRHGWLKKAYDAVATGSEHIDSNRFVFTDDSAIARFGVGKNMVASMRHWATLLGIISENADDKITRPTARGDFLFGGKGVDPYMENPATLWLIHWTLCSRPTKTTWYWVFNHYPNPFFDREQVVASLSKLAQDSGWPRSSTATIKRDVECFVRTYVSRTNMRKGAYEDSLECPLAELALIKAVGRRDGFHIVRGEKTSLPDSLFAFAVLEYWGRHTDANSLSVDALTHEPGSPGRVFALDETAVTERLQRIGARRQSGLEWTETAGLRQVTKRGEFSQQEFTELLASAYKIRGSKRAA